MMGIEELKKCNEYDIISIRGEVFEIVQIGQDFKPDIDRTTNFGFRLHNVKSKSLFPDAELIIYGEDDLKEIQFFRIKGVSKIIKIFPRELNIVKEKLR